MDFLCVQFDFTINHLLKIETTQSKKVSLIITSDVKLVETKETPEKQIIEKK